jgi:hypothetical protein
MVRKRKAERNAILSRRDSTLFPSIHGYVVVQKLNEPFSQVVHGFRINETPLLICLQILIMDIPRT